MSAGAVIAVVVEAWLRRRGNAPASAAMANTAQAPR